VVAGAAADVALEIGADLGLARVGVLGEQRRRAHHHARRAEAALQPVVLLERRLDHAERAVGVRHSLDRAHLRAVEVGREDRAGLGRQPAHVDDAGPALRGVAADMRAGQAEPLAQQIHQQRAAFDLAADSAAVHGQAHLGHRRLPRSLLLPNVC
jgi:hypothetical protein